jgi:putative transcriptional regulator
MKKPSNRDQTVNSILEGLREALAIHKGELKPARVTKLETINVLEVRQKLNISRPKFAALLGVSQRTVENWEQGRNKPSGAARALLRVAEYNPSVVLEALR